MARYELTDFEWKAITPYLPHIDTPVVRMRQEGSTAKRGIEIDVSVAPEAAFQPKSTRSSTRKSGC